MSDEKAKRPTVSVLLPVHDAERYLPEALDSILAQTYADFELIAIDDGSTDNSGAILDDYATRDPRVRVFHRPQRGLVETLNEGLDLARGEWIARMDADDIALPHRLTRQLQWLQATNADFCGGAVECFGRWRAVWRYPETHDACGVQLLFDVCFAHPAVIGRREAFRTLHYDSGFAQAQDYDLWQRAWAAGFRLANVPDIVLRYRVHDKQVSRRHESSQKNIANVVRERQWRTMFPELADSDLRAAAYFGLHNNACWAERRVVYRRLLDRSCGEALEVALFNIFRALIVDYAGSTGRVREWFALVGGLSHVPVSRKAHKMVSLIALDLLRIRPEGRFFSFFRRLRAQVLAFLDGKI
jgi:glycosyltransferase involved in cell wall biosynthesis